MKSTGVIRRIDELGRIVVPKEIRRNLTIRDGENMEIFIENDSIILKKFSKMEDTITYSNKIIEAVSKISDFKLLITDRDHIIATTKELETINGDDITNELIELIDSRKNMCSEQKDQIKISANFTYEGYAIIYPIISSDDSIGLIIILSEDRIDASLILLIQFISSFISDQFEIS